MKTIDIRAAKALADKADNGLESVDMTVDASGLNHIMRVLSNLYSRPVEAVIREYISNAIDAHIRGGITTPIDITYPRPYSNDENPVFIVRDYGSGMSKEDVKNVYSRYGTSTKGDNNTAIGGFGLGAKSGLAIADRFDAISIHNGIKLVFYVEKNHIGAGVVYFVSEETTNEPNGFEVRVPMNSSGDQDVITKMFLGVEQNVLRVNGSLVTRTVHNPEIYVPVLDTDNVSAVAWYSKNAVNVSYGNKITLNIGGVIYPFNYETLQTKGITSKVRLLSSWQKKIVFNVPIGAVELTPNREEIIYKEKSISFLNTLIDNFISAVESDIDAELNLIDSRDDVLRFADNLSSEKYWALENTLWRGEKIPLYYAVDRAAAITPPATYGKKISNHVEYGKHSSTRFHFDALEPNNIFLPFDKFPHEQIKTLRRNSRKIEEYFGFSKIILVDEKDWKNPWLLSGRRQFLSSDEIVEAAKVHSAKIRKAEKAENPKPVVRRVVEKAITFTNTHNLYEVEELFAGDSRLKAGNVNHFYLDQREHKLYPGHLAGKNDGPGIVNVDVQQFWEIFKILHPNAIVILRSGMRQADKFSSLYPNARSVVPEVTKYAKENFVPYVSVDYSTALYSTSYEVRQNISRVLSTYVVAAKAGQLDLIKNQDYLDFCEKWNKDEAEKVTPKIHVDNADGIGYASLERWSGVSVSSTSEHVRLTNEKIREVDNVIDSFYLLASQTVYTTESKLFHKALEYINLL
jgi:hypothetical protein